MAKLDSEGEYVHGTHRSEQDRLALMNRILNARTLAEVRVQPGDRILDVGSGLGQMSIAMAEAGGAGSRVLGIERSDEQIAKAIESRNAAGLSPARVEFRQGDALKLALGDGERGQFDLALTRFLLEHVPDPLAVVRQMVSAVRPGGRIVLADDDHEILRLHPEPPSLRAVWSGYMQLYTKLRNDPIVGRRLVQLLHQAGASPRRNSWVWFGACSGDPIFDATVTNLIGVLRGAEPRMVAEGLIGPDVVRGCCDVELREFAAQPDSAVWFAMSLAEGTRPE
ncbi:MAG: methyltransferase domain-containing protein [Phycisphaeraceae bacterium]|nr:methyltransferase domain-containing protein [Phycisphaeraceae bacterium]